MSDDTTQTTFADAPTSTAPMTDETTPDEATLHDRVRDPDDPAERCGYCQHVAEGGFVETARGRPACPDCGAIPSDYQRGPSEPWESGL